MFRLVGGMHPPIPPLNSPLLPGCQLENSYCFPVLGRGTHSKNKRQFPPASPSGRSTNELATRLERQMEGAQSIRTRYNAAHSEVKHHQLLLGNWNILTGREFK